MSQESPDWRFPNEATPPGSGVYYAVRFAPGGLRARHAMILAWYRRIREIARSPSDPGIARLKLDWWHAELTRAFDAGQAQHPLTLAMTSEQVPSDVAEPMHALVDAAEQAIRQPALDDVGAFHGDCARVGGRLFEVLCRLEPVATYNTGRAVALGAYWDAVDRLSRLPEWPEQVTTLLDPQRAEELTPQARRSHCEALLRYPDSGTPVRREPVPDLARRLVAVAQGLHRGLVRQGFAPSDRPRDRAPIAHLWTAWRCRDSF